MSDNVKILNDNSKQTVIEILDLLSNEDRVEIFSLYCHSCGIKDSSCRCSDDVLFD